MTDRVRPLLTLLIVLAMAAVGLGIVVPTQASAGCVGPALHLAGTSISRSRNIDLRGEFFFDGCDDVTYDEGTGPGCSHRVHPYAQLPARDVALMLRQGTHSWTLGAADASDAAHNYAIHWDVEVPKDVDLAAAELIVRERTLHVIVLP